MAVQVTTKWLGDMRFESTNPSGHNLFIDAMYGYRKSTAGALAGNETYFTLGLRLNIATKQSLC